MTLSDRSLTTLGSITILFAGFAYWYLPYNATTAKFLTEEEKRVAFLRLQMDSSSIVNEKFVFKDAVKIFKHPTSWVILCKRNPIPTAPPPTNKSIPGIEICLGVPLQSVSLFLPVIVKRLGYSAVKTNLYTVAPNITGAIMLLVLAFSSDLTRIRFPFVALGFIFTMMGMVIYASVNVTSQLQVAYFACFMMTWGTSAPSVILDVWFNNNIANENKRVMLTGVGVPVANLMGVVSSNIFLPQDAPKYFPALITTAAFGAMGCLLTLSLGAYMILDNKKRDRKDGRKVKAQDIPTELMANGPADASYRWFL